MSGTPIGVKLDVALRDEAGARWDPGDAVLRAVRPPCLLDNASEHALAVQEVLEHALTLLELAKRVVHKRGAQGGVLGIVGRVPYELGRND